MVDSGRVEHKFNQPGPGNLQVELALGRVPWATSGPPTSHFLSHSCPAGLHELVTCNVSLPAGKPRRQPLQSVTKEELRTTAATEPGVKPGNWPLNLATRQHVLPRGA